MSYDSDVVSATGGVGEADWDKIIKLCNRIRDSVGPTSMHQAMQSVMKRVKHGNPAVQIHALTLLEACVSNCGQDFQKELTTPYFQNDIKGILLGRYTDSKVSQRLKELLLSWSSEFKSAVHMKDLGKFIEQLRKDGVNFSTASVPPPSSSTASSSSSSAAATSFSPSSTGQTTQAREAEDLRKAIQLSLQDKSSPPTSSSTPSSSSSSSSNVRTVKKEVRKVRAIYDFQAAEDNELTFRAGEIVTLLDDSDENWWRGETQLGQGLFPASFVSKNLNKDPEPSKHEKKKKHKTKTEVGVANGARPEVGGAKGVVNEQKVDLLLDMLKSADVTDTSKEESKTVKQLESEVQSMRPEVEQKIQMLSSQEEAMQSVSTQFNEALTLYRKLLAEGPRLSDIAPPPTTIGVQSHSHTGQHGMTTAHETYSAHQVPVQSGMMTQQPSTQQNGMGTQPHSMTGLQQPPPQATYQSTSIPPQHGMGTVQNGMGTTHQPSLYAYTTSHEVSRGEMSLQQPPPPPPPPPPSQSSVPYQSMTMVQPQPHSSYAPPSYQPAVSMVTQLPHQSTGIQQPLSIPNTSFPPPPPPLYHNPVPPPVPATNVTQLLPQPLL